MPSSHPGSALLSSFARRRLSLSAFSWLALCAIAASCAPASNAEPSAGDEDARAAAYDSALSVGGYEAALSRIDPTEPGPDPIDEPTGPTVSVATQSAEWISLGIRTAPGTNELYRSVGSGARAKLATLASSATGYVDRAVTDGTTYCYELKNTSGAVVKWSNRACGRTLFAQYRFTGLGIPQSESDSIVAHFDWHRTEALYAGGAEPQLWYMNVLIDAPDSLRVLRAAGVHAQSTPVFEAERNALAPHATLPSTGGVPAGMWVYAIVPAPLYNDMRAQMIARADAGQAQIFRAAVFRSVPDAAARVWPNTAYSPLSSQHLAEQGLEYNGETAQECYVVNGERVCALRREIVGWLGRKIFHFVAELIEDVVDDVRLAWGKYKRIVKGEATLSLDFAVHNTDTAFAGNLQSGWAERAILLKNLRVKVYQGFAGERDYMEAAQAFSAAGLPGEAKSVLEEGVSTRTVDPTKPTFKEAIAAANRDSAAAKSKLAGLRSAAAAAPTGTPALQAGDQALSFGDYAGAAELYRTAVQKGGADSDAANMRLGIALALAGRAAEADSAFRSVSGSRSELANLWLLWLGQRS